MRRASRSGYARTRQTERAIRHFWEPVVVATLNDTFERCSMKYAGKVFHELFLQIGGRRAAGYSDACR